MKFAYDTPTRNPDEAVAWLDDDGDLVIKGVTGDHVCLTKKDVIHYNDDDLNDTPRGRLFFPGDTLTITF